MQPTSLPLSRRRFLIGSGMAINGFYPLARAQTPSGIAPDGFRILRIRPVVLALPVVGTPTVTGFWSPGATKASP